MPSREELAKNISCFLDQILPKASSSTSWTLPNARKAFRWAQFCQKLYQSLSPEELKLLDRHLPIPDAPLLLLEEFLRNTDLPDSGFQIVIQGACEVFSVEELSELFKRAISRKAVYSNAIALIQQEDDSLINQIRASLIKQDISENDQIQPLLQSSSSLELLLLSLDGSQQTPKILDSLETALKDWLDRGIRPNLIGAMLAVPVGLSRSAFLKSSSLFGAWLDCLNLIAGQFVPVYYEAGESSWRWPEEEDRIPRFSGLSCSLDQLIRQFESFLKEKDSVKEAAEKFLADDAHFWPASSVWLEIGQRF